MNPRSKRYFDKKKAGDGSKKGSANLEGYNEENQENYRKAKENPAPSKTEDIEQQQLESENQEDPNANAPARQDDTGGGNNSGKRQDPH